MWGRSAKQKTHWGKKRLLKTIALVVKRDKLATEKPVKSKQPKIAKVELRVDGETRVQCQWHKKAVWG